MGRFSRTLFLVAAHGPLMVAAMTMGDHALVKELAAKALADLESESAPPALRGLSRTMNSLLESPEQGIAELRRMRQDSAFDFPGAHLVISAYASCFGDHHLALEVFQETLKLQLFSPLIVWRPIHKEMRRLPGFKDLASDFGLVDYWRGTGNWGDLCRPVGDNDFECA